MTELTRKATCFHCFPLMKAMPVFLALMWLNDLIVACWGAWMLHRSREVPDLKPMGIAYQVLWLGVLLGIPLWFGVTRKQTTSLKIYFVWLVIRWTGGVVGGLIAIPTWRKHPILADYQILLYVSMALYIPFYCYVGYKIVEYIKLVKISKQNEYLTTTRA